MFASDQARIACISAVTLSPSPVAAYSTFGGMVGYTVRVLRRGRALAEALPESDDKRAES